MLGQVWIKTFVKDKLKFNILYSSTKSNVEETLYCALKELDISQPIWNIKHKKEWNNFGLTRFKPNDFIDNVNFDFLEISYIAPKVNKNKK
ncbi:MAG: hypothetical protein GYA87_01340 [Christensenellaceae bacterium]|nr:hypothetical protein [Christensenellaceae bacterium]